MNHKEYQKIVNNIPLYGAIFTLIKVPGWLDGDPRVSKGMEVIVLENGQVYLPESGYADVKPSYLKFEKYVQVEEDIHGHIKRVAS